MYSLFSVFCIVCFMMKLFSSLLVSSQASLKIICLLKRWVLITYYFVVKLKTWIPLCILENGMYLSYWTVLKCSYEVLTGYLIQAPFLICHGLLLCLLVATELWTHSTESEIRRTWQSLDSRLMIKALEVEKEGLEFRSSKHHISYPATVCFIFYTILFLLHLLVSSPVILSISWFCLQLDVSYTFAFSNSTSSHWSHSICK